MSDVDGSCQRIEEALGRSFYWNKREAGKYLLREFLITDRRLMF